MSDLDRIFPGASDYRGRDHWHDVQEWQDNVAAYLIAHHPVTELDAMAADYGLASP